MRSEVMRVADAKAIAVLWMSAVTWTLARQRAAAESL